MIRGTGIAAILALAGSAARAADSASGIGAADVSNVLMSLLLVVGFIFGAAFFVKRLPVGIGARGSGPLKIVATLALGPKERLLLVEARGAEVLVALGPAGVAIAHPAAESVRFGALLAAAGEAAASPAATETADARAAAAPSQAPVDTRARGETAAAQCSPPAPAEAQR